MDKVNLAEELARITFAAPDDRRDPAWNTVIEFWFDGREAMEAAWRSEARRPRHPG